MIAQGQRRTDRPLLGRGYCIASERRILSINLASTAYPAVALRGEGGRLLRDLGLCLSGTLLGIRLDGAWAYREMQAICGQSPWNLPAKLAVHFTLLPATSMLMLAVVVFCFRRTKPMAPTPARRCAAMCGQALLIAALFVGMLVAMSLAQWPMSRVLPPSTAGAVSAALVGMAVSIVLLHAVRLALERAGVLVPVCCR
ncbi:hypothetical protein [Novosphingobium colocasiae]|uniref:Uncharacterized protein n=1 Tax=Novosphingobium colocasiae TaxID=1256513 RepID=A0A918PIZ9_9SPHN|nr:hypothetical protein [Novosphingobium colocasiae]GGZ10198.1 hypothetical protein GCM10011614_26380 [Novosphingobium colocasiae]